MKGKKEDRYTGSATTIWSYMTEFLVKCSKCGREAMVRVGNSYLQNDGKLSCHNCMFKEDVRERVRYKLIVKKNCDNCGKQIDQVIPEVKDKPGLITTPCPSCGIIREVKPKFEKYILAYPNSGEAYDPVFKLPLWFQADIKGSLFWAFNRTHLRDIKDYVQAKLRERSSMTFTTMVEKLPSFLKAAKNRSLILKVIERLERKSL